MQGDEVWRNRRIPLVGAGLAIALAGGCAGAKYKIDNSGLEYPVSLSGAMPDADGNLHVLGENLEPVGTIDEDWFTWGVAYGFTGGTVEIAEVVNRRIREAGGDGAAALKIKTSVCGLNYFPVLTILPFWPGCAGVKVEGTIVKLKDPDQPDIPMGPTYPIRTAFAGGER